MRRPNRRREPRPRCRARQTRIDFLAALRGAVADLNGPFIADIDGCDPASNLGVSESWTGKLNTGLGVVRMYEDYDDRVPRLLHALEALVGSMPELIRLAEIGARVEDEDAAKAALKKKTKRRQ